MIESCPWLQSALSSWVEFWFIKVVPKYLDSSTRSNELLFSFILSLRPTFWSRDTTMYVVLSALSSIPVSLLVTSKAAVLFFTVCKFPSNTLTPAASTKSWCVPLNFKPSCFTWALLLAYSKANLKRKGNKITLRLRSFVTGNRKHVRQLLAYPDSAISFIQTHLY